MERLGIAIDAADLWWSEIAGPGSYLTRMEEAISEGTPIFAVVSHALPYRWKFRGELWNRAGALGLEPHFVKFDPIYEEPDEDVGETLLQSFNMRDIALPEYIRQKRNPQYLKKCRVFDGRLIWVKGLSKRRLEKWIKFLSVFHSGNSANRGPGAVTFVIEVIDKASLPDKLPGNLCRLDYVNFIQEDDLRLFASTLVESRLFDETSAVKRYAAEVVTSLCGIDCEVADALVCKELVYQNPIELLTELINATFSDSHRGYNDLMHPFSLLKANAMDKLLRKIWIAQLRTAYPLIEHERLDIVSTYEPEIENALKAHIFTDFDGERVLNPYDVEIGLLSKLIRTRGDDGSYLLYIPDDMQRERVAFLRMCRNTLAHMNICDIERFRSLLCNSQPAHDVP